jgi:ribosomal protein S18 acetylase RimI-like enzyme
LSPGALCTFLPWDSSFFGHRIARLRDGRLKAETLAETERWCRDERIDALYFLADVADPATAALAEAAGFRLVDVRVTLGRAVDPRRTSAEGARRSEEACRTPTVDSVRPARPTDLPALRRIAAASHHDSRFYADPHFERERCDELYATWIEKSCASDGDTAVWVAEIDGRPAGYVTVRLATPKTGEIGLIAVAHDAQGRGLGGLLVGRALEDLAARGASRVSVVTQGRNLRAQRLYQRLGFSTEALGLWFHRWFV